MNRRNFFRSIARSVMTSAALVYCPGVFREEVDAADMVFPPSTFRVGSYYDVIIYDDVVSEEDFMTKEQRGKVIEIYRGLRWYVEGEKPTF